MAVGSVLLMSNFKPQAALGRGKFPPQPGIEPHLKRASILHSCR